MGGCDLGDFEYKGVSVCEIAATGWHADLPDLPHSAYRGPIYDKLYPRRDIYRGVTRLFREPFRSASSHAA